MERRGNITLVQRFGGIAWFHLAYGCNNNKEGNSYNENPLLILALNAFIKAILASGGGHTVLEHRASFFCYEKLGELLRSVQMLCWRSQNSLLYFSFLCLLNANCNFQKRGLKDFVRHSVYSC